MRIEFLGVDADYAAAFDPPQPARDLLPEWYKRQGNYVGEKAITEMGMYSSTIKHCMPALDAMTAGYVLTLPTDIHVTKNDQSGVSTGWPYDAKMIESHSPQQVSELTIDAHTWNPSVLKLVNRWVIKTPPGYSTLFTQPMWRDDHRFQVFQGIVDTDTYPQPINFPFLVRQGYTGTLENGLPFVQLIPFKRDEWTATTGVNTPENNRAWLRATRQSIHRYKDHFRTIKRFS